MLRVKINTAIIVIFLIISGIFYLGKSGFSILSGLRAYVGGEGLWAKSQKQATYQLIQYIFTKEEQRYQLFLDSLKVPFGDRTARLELGRMSPDEDIVFQGFSDGGNHPEDIPTMIDLFKKFKNQIYISRAIEQWEIGDSLMMELVKVGEETHHNIKSNLMNSVQTSRTLAALDELQERLNEAENLFSYNMSMASRWAANLLFIIIMIFTIAGSIICFIMLRLMAGLITELNDKNLQLANQAEIEKVIRTELKDSEELYRSLLENIDLGIALIDNDHNIIMSNYALNNLFKKPPLYFHGKKCYQEYVKKDKTCENCPGVRAISTGKPSEIITDGIMDDGSQITVRIKAFPVLEKGKGRFIEVVEDISNQVQADKAFHTLVESAVGNTGQDLYDRIVSQLANWLDCEIAILSRIDFEKGVMVDFAMIADGKLTRENVYQLAHSPCEAVMKKGFQIFTEGVSGLFPVDHALVEFKAEGYVGLPLKGANDEVLGILCAISRHKLSPPPRLEQVMEILATRAATEIERNRFEIEKVEVDKQLQHVQKLESLGILAGGIAHDFNNLLMVVLGYADLALKKLTSASPVYKNITSIQVAAQRAAELCQQMLAYSGRGNFVIQTLNLNEIVREMTHMLEVSISKKAIIKFNYAENLPSVNADATQVRQIIMNLIVNASEAIGDKSGVISLSIGAMVCNHSYLEKISIDKKLPEGIYVYLEVSDTGSGMDKETRLKLFDPFFTTKFTGRGLGLSAVQGIIRGHKGGIKVYSEPGKGTTFKILFPADKDSIVEKALMHKKSDEKWQGTGTLLLVDDEDTVLAVGKEMIEYFGFKVITANDGQEAIQVFHQHQNKIDGVIMDLTMPHMDGEEAFRELRSIRPDIRVVISSGYNEQDINEKFSGKGLSGFIKKPYQMETLSAILKQVFGGSNNTTP